MMRSWGPGHPNWSMPGQREVGMLDVIRETLRLGAPPATDVPASASWLTSDSPQNHVEDRACRACSGAGRMLDDRPFTNSTRIGPAPTCWSCGGTGRAR